MAGQEIEEMTSKLGTTGDFLVISIRKTEDRLENEDTSSRVSVDQTEHWIFQIEAEQTLRRRPHNAGPSVQAFKEQAGVSPAVPFLDPEEGIVGTPLLDQAGKDVLRNDEDDMYVYHVAVAPLQEKLRVYPQVPDSQPGGAFPYLTARRPAPTEGDIIGYVDGQDIGEFHDPDAELAEQLIWNDGESSNITFGLFNSDTERRILPKLSIYGAAYSISPVMEDDEQRKVLNAAFRGSDNVVNVQWGAVRDSFSYQIPDEWQASGNVVEKKGSSAVDDILGEENTEALSNAASNTRGI
jgi:hypothetical protein